MVSHIIVLVIHTEDITKNKIEKQRTNKTHTQFPKSVFRGFATKSL